MVKPIFICFPQWGHFSSELTIPLSLYPRNWARLNPQRLAICSTLANVIVPLFICWDNADWLMPIILATEEIVCPWLVICFFISMA